MSKMARSQSCQDGGMSNCSSNPSHSPELQRMTHEKRERRITDRKYVGGVESRPIKDEHAADERGRSRSKSPRRNSWREEIKQIKSWKDERENREIKFEDIRHDRQGWNRGRASRKSSKCFKKAVNPANKFDLLSSSRKFVKKDARLVKETSCRLDKKRKERLTPLVLERRGERLSRWKQVKKSSNIVKDVEMGLVKERKTDRKSLDKSQTTQALMVNGDSTALKTSSKDSADISYDELELRISDKDVFPELRDVQFDRVVCAVHDVVRDDMEGKATTKNCEGLKNETKQSEDEVEDKKKAEPTRAWSLVIRDSKFDQDIGTVRNEEMCPPSLTTPVAVLSDEGSSAMARNFSLLELKMEVYTTRLKELEWEREQLRKEREVFQDKELFVKRDLLKSLLEQNMLNVNFNLCNKENKG